MYSIYETPDERLPYTIRTIKHLAKERGWGEILAFDADHAFLLATRPDGQQLRLYSSTPPTTSFFANELVKNKYATYELLLQAGIKQPATIILPTTKDNWLTESAQTVARDFLAIHKQIVVKPFDGAHGNGISTSITTWEQLRIAIVKASQYIEHPLPQVILQQQLYSQEPELRVICIDYQFVLAAARIPAAVTGDGVHTVEQLIDWENEHLRTVAYQSDLAYINRDNALKFLGDKAKFVPASGQQIPVTNVCNVGQGGTMKDVSTQIDDEIKTMAVKVAKILQLPVAGVDFFGDMIIEVNACPALYHPISGRARTLAVIKYLEYLEKIPLEKTIS